MGINKMSLRLLYVSFALLMFALSASHGSSAQSFKTASPPFSFQAGEKFYPQEILKTAAENGRLAMAALREYTYYTELTIETVSQADTITGKYYRFNEIYFDREGNRREKNLESKSTLPKDVYIGTSSANNLVRIYQFIITPETLGQYEFTYVGREQVDELKTYVFDVTPKVKMPDPDEVQERYFRGRIWIDDQDVSVVKVAGEALPEQKGRRTPRFETYFQNQDKYWFPAYSSADDRMRIDKYPARVIVKLRFTGYKKVNLKG
jgi:hypothetical protein